MTATWKEEPVQTGQEKPYGLDVVNVRLVRDSPIYSSVKLDNPTAVAKAVGDVMRRFDREVLAVVNLHADGSPINVNFATIGTADMTLASGREVLKSSILSGAAKVMLMHNHPDGSVEPSRHDTMMTDTLNKAFALMDIELVDHVIVGDASQGMFSYRQKGVMKKTVKTAPEDVLDFDFSRKDFREAFRLEAERHRAVKKESEALVPRGYELKAKKKTARVENTGEGPMEYGEFFSAFYMRLLQLPQDFWNGVKLEAHPGPRGSGMKYDSLLVRRNGSAAAEQVYIYPYYRKYLRSGSLDSACGSFTMDYLLKEDTETVARQTAEERKAGQTAPKKRGPKL